jgi:hypothetical protein
MLTPNSQLVTPQQGEIGRNDQQTAHQKKAALAAQLGNA